MREDYRQQQDGDLDFSTGDLILTESTGQHQRDIILADKGHIRNNPETGCGAMNFINDSKNTDYLRTVRMELIADGMKVKKIGTNNEGTIIIDAEYEDN